MAEEFVYQVDERARSNRDLVLYTVQWLATLIYGVVWGYAIVGLGLGFEGAELTTYMAAIVLVTGLSTLTQAWQGHRFAMVSGPNVIPSLAIVAAEAVGGRDYALGAITAQVFAGVLVFVLAVFGVLNLIRRIWSPIILGSMVLVVGLAIAPEGLNLLTAAGFDWTFWVGAALAFGGIVLAIRGRGVWSTLPILFIVTIGYVVFIAAGEIDWDPVTDADLFVLPEVFPYGFEWPPLDLVVIMTVVGLMSALNMFGNVDGYGEVVGRDMDDRRARRAFSVFGAIENVVPGILGAPATVPYGENLGIVAVTRVAARQFVLIASAIFVVFAFIGPLVGLMAAMPEPVAGAVLLGVASAAIGIGIDIMTTAPAFQRREQTMVGFAVFLAIGLSQLPGEVWENVPQVVATVFENPIVSVIIFVIVLEQIVFRGSEKAAETSANPEGAPKPSATGDEPPTSTTSVDGPRQEHRTTKEAP